MGGEDVQAVQKKQRKHDEDKKRGWSKGAKVAASGAALVGLGAVGVGGVILGDALTGGDMADSVAGFAVEAADATADGVSVAADTVADFAGDAGEELEAFAGDAADWLEDAGEDVGDFIMGSFLIRGRQSCRILLINGPAVHSMSASQRMQHTL